MILEQHLQLFYKQNGIPKNGGINDDFFDFKVFDINLKLPNPQFRKDLIHIHDIQHILNNCDTTWKGEAYISGWEISTGIWKHFPIAFLSLWAMGYSLWLHPSDVFHGYKKGLSQHGIIDLHYSKEEILKMEFEELKKITQKKSTVRMRLLQWVQFISWSILSLIILLFPILIILIGILFYI